MSNKQTGGPVDRRERDCSLTDLLLAAQDGFQTKLWTAMPCIVNKYNAVKRTIEAQPAIKVGVLSSLGNWRLQQLPLLLDVPVCFPGSGGFTMTFPIVQGDECLVVFSSRCIDSWWQNGGVQPPAEFRMHDLSDGFAIFAPSSQPKMIGNISTTSVQLRSNDGQLYIELAAGHVANIVAPGGLNITGPVNIHGAVTQDGGNLSSNGKVLHTHTHTGVQAGGSNTGPPA